MQAKWRGCDGGGLRGQEGSEVMVENLRQLWLGTAAGLVLCFTAWGCTSVEELPAPTGVFSVKGEVIGSAIPERAGTVIYWEPDPYAGGPGYIFGTGRTLGTEFIVSVPSVPTLEQPAGPLVVFGKNYAVGKDPERGSLSDRSQSGDARRPERAELADFGAKRGKNRAVG